MSHPGPEQQFAARLAADPGSPLVTFYDDATGERAELSAKSLGNWVAKTHFLLMDELGAAVGDRAFARLPVHWLAAPILLGCWYAGLEVVTDPAAATVAACSSCVWAASSASSASAAAEASAERAEPPRTTVRIVPPLVRASASAINLRLFSIP